MSRNRLTHRLPRASGARRAPAFGPALRAAALACASLCTASAARLSAQQVAEPGADELPVRRWLVSGALPSQGDEASDPLAGPGATVVFPDRGVERGGTSWRLVRLEEADTLRLDSLLPDRPEDARAYAHVYIRSPEDRAARLAWSGTGGTRVRAWLNGRPLLGLDVEPVVSKAGREAAVRVVLGAGWNTFLLRADADGREPYGLAAALLPDSGGAQAVEGGLPSQLAGIRIRASRPPGDIRTGPDSRLLVAGAARELAQMAWRDDELVGYVGVDLTAWSRTPIDEVRVEAKVGGAGTKGVARWLTPGSAVTVALPVPLERIARAVAESRDIEAELRWDRNREKRLLKAPGVGPAVAGTGGVISLLGWKAIAAPETAPIDEIRSPDALPDGPGWVLEGEWHVPEALAGRRLALDAAGAPGDWQVDGRSVSSANGAPVLCDPCRKGEKWQISVRTSGRWEALPRVVAGAPGGVEPEGTAS